MFQLKMPAGHEIDRKDNGFFEKLDLSFQAGTYHNDNFYLQNPYDLFNNQYKLSNT